MNKPVNNNQSRRTAGNNGQQIRRWPMATIGAALVAGYLLGRRVVPAAVRNIRSGWATSKDAQTSNSRAVQNSAEHDPSADVPANEHHGRVPSQAPNASFATGAGATGFDSPPITSSYLSNTDVGGPEEGRPYFPPGGAPDRERSGPEQGGDDA